MSANRRLAAILAADVVGYSRLMGEDEAGTAHAVREHHEVAEVQKAFPKAKAIDGERVRFEVHGGDYRMIAAFDFPRRMVFVKFIGTHAEYDRIDPRTVSQF